MCGSLAATSAHPRLSSLQCTTLQRRFVWGNQMKTAKIFIWVRHHESMLRNWCAGRVGPGNRNLDPSRCPGRTLGVDIGFRSRLPRRHWRLRIRLPMHKLQESRIWSLGQEDPLQKEMTTRSSILVWKILWTEELGGLQFMGSQRVGHNWATEHSLLSLGTGRPQLIWSVFPVQAPWGLAPVMLSHLGSFLIPLLVHTLLALLGTGASPWSLFHFFFFF